MRNHERRSVPHWARAAAFGAAGAALLACGPNFPNRLLMMGDAAVLSAPSADFKREIERVLPKAALGLTANPPAPGSDVFAQSAQADAEDLRAALGAGATEDLLRRYQEVRAGLGGPGREGAGPRTAAEGIPAEFGAYLSGLVEFRSGRVAEARATWERLLAMPEGERRWRSTWAAFMLGRSYLAEDPAKAIAWLRRTRELAAAGFSDRLGLAASSLGWEAKAELGLGHVERAVELYMEQMRAGDPTALLSLRLVGAGVAGGDLARLETLARHLPTQRVVTAYLVSRGGPVASSPRPISKEFGAAWLRALERSGAADVTSADRLAWAAYQCGDMAASERWARVAPDESGMAWWVRAKLLLRAGKVDEATAALARASRSFPADERWAWLALDEGWDDVSPGRSTLGESGTLLLARGHYAQALDALLRAGYWSDAAYVAERVLSADELRAYLDRSWPTVRPCSGGFEEWWDTGRATPEQLAARLKYVLGRRLARLGKYDDAAVLMPVELRGALASLAQLVRAGHDPKHPAADRARSLWAAAQLTRANGMELLGTEVGPDVALHDGSFAYAVPGGGKQPRPEGTLVGPGADEVSRVAASGPDPDRRFHYRFAAARLAWEAAELMPDGADATARVLCEAGTWIKAQEPKEAERFYKALVRRCGATTLGKEAARLHWFPKLDDVSK